MTGASFPLHSHLRLVQPAPPPRRRLAVQISVLDGRSAFGRSRIFRLHERDLDQLVDAAIRPESRR